MYQKTAATVGFKASLQWQEKEMANQDVNCEYWYSLITEYMDWNNRNTIITIVADSSVTE